jgi:hypothetical protein
MADRLVWVAVISYIAKRPSTNALAPHASSIAC